MENISWRDSLAAAQDEAAKSGKLVFLELFSPKCAGCMNVESRTLPDPRVEALLSERFVPFRYDVLAEPDRMKEYVAAWTPTMIVLDGQGREQRRSMGFLAPEHFLSEMALAQTTAALELEHYDDAARFADEALKLSAGDALRHPEALYWQAVARYKTSHNQDDLIGGWKALIADFPDSDWAQRVDFVSAM